MERTLIVARMDPSDAPPVSRLFAESDGTELPALLQVRDRRLFHFHGLYFHLVEAEDGLGERLRALRGNPLYEDLAEGLTPYVSAYDPQTWRGPRDAMATEFYSWRSA